jgi:hypothetical protein
MKQYNFVFSVFDETLNISNDFVKKIKKIKLKHHSFNKSSFYIKEKKEENDLKILIIDEIGDYFNKILKILKYSKFTLIDSWIQKYDGKGNYHDCHIHDARLYSFVLYVDCSKNSSKTVFYNPCYPYVSVSTLEIKPEKGRCIFFNGAIPHTALPNFDKKRLIVSGNIKLE